MLPDISQEEITRKLDHFSISQVLNILECPARWAFHYLYDFPKGFKKGQILDIGKFFHDEAKGYSLKIIDPVKEEILSRMIKRVPPTKKFTSEDYPPIIDEFLKLYGGLNFENKNTEIEISGYVSDIPLKYLGYIDHLEDNLITDLKIKGELPTEYSESEYYQQGFYSMILNKPRTRLAVLAIDRKKRIYQSCSIYKEYTQEDYDNILKKISRAVKLMYLGFYSPLRTNPYCNYAMCEFWRTCHEFYP